MAFVTIEDLYGTAEVIVFESAYIKSGKSLLEENIVMVEGRLSIREDETTTIIANEIKDFNEAINKNKSVVNYEGMQQTKVLVLNITNASEEQKEKLRGAIRFFEGDKNNINVKIQVGEELKDCRPIYLTNEIFKVFQEIVGEENIKIE